MSQILISHLLGNWEPVSENAVYRETSFAVGAPRGMKMAAARESPNGFKGLGVIIFMTVIFLP
jgi:hypothetical protein